MKISQLSRAINGQDKFNRILAFILAQYKYFQVAEFSSEPLSYSSHPVKADVGDTNGSRRIINGILEKFVYSPSDGNGVQKTYGYEYEIDRAYLADLDVSITADGLRRQIEGEQIRLAKQVAFDVLFDMINGDGNTQILGLKNLIKDVADSSGQTSVFGLTQAQLQSSLLQMSMQLNLSDKVALRIFEEELIKVFTESGDNSVLVVNPLMHARLASVAKELNSYTELKTDFGKPIDAIAGHMILPVPLAALPQTESDGTNSDCSSIFVVDFNETDGVRYATNSGFYFVDFENLETKPTGKSRLEFIGNTKIEDAKKIKRLSRIRL